MSPFFKLEPSPSFYELCLDEPKLALSHLESCYNLSSFRMKNANNTLKSIKDFYKI